VFMSDLGKLMSISWEEYQKSNLPAGFNAYRVIEAISQVRNPIDITVFCLCK
jgi:hypothetical protein